MTNHELAARLKAMTEEMTELVQDLAAQGDTDTYLLHDLCEGKSFLFRASQRAVTLTVPSLTVVR